MDDNEAQKDELLVLENIYLEEELSLNEDQDDARGGTIYCYQDLPNDFIVACRNEEDSDLMEITVSHLPPIVLNFNFPKNYPSESPPEFTLSCQWLSNYKLNRLSKKLRDIWKEKKGYAILHAWIEFLKSQPMEFLKINNNRLEIIIKSRAKLNRSSAVKSRLTGSCDANKRPCLSTTRLKPRLLTGDRLAVPSAVTASHFVQHMIVFNEERSKKIFWRSSYGCGICFDSKKGPESFKFQPCGHVYCRLCITDYFTVRIKDGFVHEMPCPRDKCSSQATQKQVENVVGSLLYDKYENIQLTAALSTMNDITYCPRLSCNSPVVKEGEEKLGICPSCTHPFCIYCRMTYHGESDCRVRSEDAMEVIEEYEMAGREKRKQMEKKYGKKQLVNILEGKSESWVTTHSKKCPKCCTKIERVQGCDHMQCSRCGSHFCWACFAILDPERPYRHYETRSCPAQTQVQ